MVLGGGAADGVAGAVVVVVAGVITIRAADPAGQEMRPRVRLTIGCVLGPGHEPQLKLQ